MTSKTKRKKRPVKLLKSGDGFISFNGNRENPVLIASFRGSRYKPEDWFGTNFKFRKNMIGFCKSKQSSHRGFLNRYLSNQQNFKKQLRAIIRENNLTETKVTIVFTGHSLGGALAHLAALDFKLNSRIKARVKLITTNSPRVFQTGTAHFAERIIGRHHILRVWRKGDIVSSLPPKELDYEHIGRHMMIPELYQKSLLEQHLVEPMVSWTRKHGVEVGSSSMGDMTTCEVLGKIKAAAGKTAVQFFQNR